MTYQEKLLDPRWQRKRLEILQDDEWQCQKCHATENTLHVHHLYYEKGRDPWDYSRDALIILCASCHEDETRDRPVEEQELLDSLRRGGYFYNHLFQLSVALHYFGDVCGKDLTTGVSILVRIMNDEKLYAELVARCADEEPTPYGEKL